MLSILIMHPSIKLKIFNKNLMSASSEHLNIRPILHFSFCVTSSFSAIHMTRCNSCHIALWMSFKRRQRAHLRWFRNKVNSSFSSVEMAIGEMYLARKQLLWADRIRCCKYYFLFNHGKWVSPDT
jgi:hypothetical protein